MIQTVRRLREGDVRPLVEDLWLPFAREVEPVAGRNALADDVDLVAAGDRLRVGELSVRGPYRGEGVAGDLLDRVDAA